MVNASQLVKKLGRGVSRYSVKSQWRNMGLFPLDGSRKVKSHLLQGIKAQFPKVLNGINVGF
jgi:hypothetical protein